MTEQTPALIARDSLTNYFTEHLFDKLHDLADYRISGQETPFFTDDAARKYRYAEVDIQDSSLITQIQAVSKSSEVLTTVRDPNHGYLMQYGTRGNVDTQLYAPIQYEVDGKQVTSLAKVSSIEFTKDERSSGSFLGIGGSKEVVPGKTVKAVFTYEGQSSDPTHLIALVPKG